MPGRQLESYIQHKTGDDTIKDHAAMVIWR